MLKDAVGKGLSKLRRNSFLNAWLRPRSRRHWTLDVASDAPRELFELVGRIWAEPLGRIPTNKRWGRMLLAVREVIC
eukprot:3612810-Pyramimonas_sp.AAC.1